MLLAALSLPWASKAQLTLNDYTFSTGTDANKWITVPTTEPSLITPGAGDYGASSLCDIGFAFPFASGTYTKFSVNSDGNLRLGNTVTGTNNYSTPFSSANAVVNNPKINVMGCDGFLSDSGYVRKYNTVDLAGDSLLVIEFATSTYNTTSRNSLLKWQVHLYPNGNITIVYAATQPPILPAVTRQCGMCVDATDIWLINASHVATHYTAGQSGTIATNTWPNANRYYTFTAPVISCPAPAVTLSDLNPTDATVALSPSGSESGYYYSLNGSDWEYYTSTSLYFDNLTPQTNYTLRVRAYCGADDTSYVNTLSFTTPCEAIAADSLPWTYGFEDASGTTTTSTFNPCLGRHQMGTTTNYPSPNTNHHSGTKGLSLYRTSSIQSWLTLPLFEEDIDQLQLSFWAYRSTTTNYGYWVVGVMTDPNDISTLDTLATGHVSTNSVWEFVEVPLAGYTGNGQYIAIVAEQTGTSTGYTYIDDITVDHMPTCIRPTEVTVDSTLLTATSATLDIVHPDATTFMVLWHRNNTTGWDTLEVSGTSFTLDSLQTGLIYEGRVYTICGSDTTLGFATFSVTTACNPLTLDDLPYSEDFEAYGTGAAYPINGCWDKNLVGSGTTTTFPYPYSSAAINGSRGLYFYSGKSSSVSYGCWAALPPIDENMEMSDLMVNFGVKRGTSVTNTSTYTYTCRLVVGVAETAGVGPTFVPVDTLDFSTGAASSVHSAEVSFADYTGTGKYVVFYAEVPANVTTYNYNTVYVDDVVLRQIPSCYWPSAVVLDTVSTDEATLSWTPDPRTPNPSSWTVEYGPRGFTLGEGMVETTNDTSIILSNLDVNTEYDVYVSANCGGDVSEPTSFRFQTNSVPATLPYYTGFEAEQDSGWVFLNADQTNRWMIGSHGDATVSGSRALFISDNGTSPNYNITTASIVYAFRLLEVTDTGDYVVSFDWRAQGESTYDYLRAFVVPNDVTITPANLNGITATATPTGWLNVGNYNNAVKLNLNGTWTNNETICHVGAGQTGLYKLVFLWRNDLSTGTMPPATVDNVHVWKITCPAPTNVTADSVGAYQIDYSWTAHGTEAGGWEVKLNNGPWIPVSTNSYSATGLTPVTNYTFMVRAICGDEDTSMLSEPLTVRTTLDCGPNSINIIDTIGNGTSASSTYTFHSSSSYRTGFSSTIYTAAELNDMGLQTNNRINGIKLHSGTTGGTIRKAKVYLKETSLDAIGSTAANDTVDRSTMTLVYSGDLVVPTSSWVEIMFDSVFTYSGNSNLLVNLCHDTNATAGVSFYYTSTSPDYLSLYGYRSTTTAAQNTVYRTNYRPNIVFNVCTEIPPCIRPTDVEVLNVVDTAMTLTWNGNAANYEVAVSTTSINPDSTTGFTTYTVADDTITINGLTQNTTYYYYVRALCSATEHSEWTIEGSVRTACSAQSLPYTENFDSYPAGTTAAAGQTMSPCWRKGTNSTTAYPYLYTTNKHSAPNGLYMYGTATSYCYAALPLMADSVKHLMMSFSAYKTSATYGKIWVGVMTNPDDFTTFQRYQRVNVSAVSTWESFEIDFSGYTGPEGCIAFTLHDSAANNAVLDDITVDVIPTCPRPANVTVGNIGQNTATVHWTHSAQNFEIEYGPAGFVQGNGTTVTSVVDSVVLTGLALGTAYDVYVRAICSATDIGEWSFATSFYTECGIFPVPYFEDFENYTATSTSPIHPCWTKGTNNSTAYPYPSTTVVSSAKSLYFYSYHPSTSSSTAYYCYAALPEFSAPINTLELSFKMRRYSTATDYYTSLVVVGVMTNPANINTFTAVDTIDLKTAAASSIHEISVDFSGYTGTGGHIALYAPVPPLYGTATYSYNYFHVDDIYVGYIPACPRADNLTAEDATQNSVVLSWRDTIGSTQWVVSYAQDTSDNWTEVTANSNPFVLTGLTPNTIYKYKVAPICAGGQQSDWSRTTYRFNTAMVPATVPYTYNFEDAAEWQNWGTISNNNAKWYRGTMAAGDTTNVMYLSADNGSTNSWLRAQVTNSAAYRDIDFGPVPHSFEVSFRYHGGGHNTGNYDGVTVLLEDPTDIPVASNTYLEGPWGHFGVVHARRDTTWDTHTVLFDNISGVHRVAFLHFNNAVSADTAYLNIAPAIDDITITMQTCERPDSVTVDAINSTFATVHWLGDTAGTYVVDYRPAGTTGTDHYDTVTSLSAVITGLTASTTYNVRVRRICDDTTVSYWSNYATFTTALCQNAGVATIGDETSTTTTYASPVNNLWKNTLTETIIDSTELTGISDITTIGYYYNYATAMTKKTNVDIWIQPTTKSEFAGTTASDAEPLNTATALKVYHGPLNCSQGWNYFVLDTAFHYSGSGNLMVIVDDNSGQYDASSYTFKSTSTSQYKTFAFYSDSDNPDINNIPNSAGTKARYQYRVVMKLIDCGVSTVCNAPEIVYDTTTETTATLTWTPTNAASYEVAMVQGTWVEPTAGTGVTGNTYTFSNLQPGTDYVLGVRAVCGENSYSDWTTVTVTTATHPCYAPTGLTITNITFDGGSIGWVVGEQGQTAFQVNLHNSTLDSNILVNDATTLTLTGLYSGTDYEIKVRAVCGTDNYSDWSNMVTLTPISCDAPTNVQAPNVTATTAIITWAGTASQYEVRYGVDISTSTGDVVVVENTTTASLTGLDPETEYDVYVRAICAEGVSSDWTAKFQFTTSASSGVTYTVTLTKNDNNGGTVEGAGTYEQGATATIKAIPAEGYYFAKWSDNDTHSVRQIVVNSDIDLMAYFYELGGIDDVYGSEVVLYPNPASTQVTLAGLETGATVNVVDLNGRSCGQWMATGESMTIDLTGYAQGAYFVRIVGEQGTAVRKLIVK